MECLIIKCELSIGKVKKKKTNTDNSKNEKCINKMSNQKRNTTHNWNVHISHKSTIVYFRSLIIIMINSMILGLASQVYKHITLSNSVQTKVKCK